MDAQRWKVTGKIRRIAEEQRRYARLHPLGTADGTSDPRLFGYPWPDVSWGLTLNR